MRNNGHPNRNVQVPGGVRIPNQPPEAYVFIPDLENGIAVEELAMIFGAIGIMVPRDVYDRMTSAGVRRHAYKDVLDADGKVVGKEHDPENDVMMPLTRHFKRVEPQSNIVVPG